MVARPVCTACARASSSRCHPSAPIPPVTARHRPHPTTICPGMTRADSTTAWEPMPAFKSITLRSPNDSASSRQSERLRGTTDSTSGATKSMLRIT